MNNRTLEVLHALVDLRAIARGNGMEVRMGVERPERRAPIEVRVAVMSSVGGLQDSVRRGESAAAVLRGMIRSLEQSGVTSRAYEGDPGFRNSG